MYHGSFVLLFFFSSRRRHTRLQGDWSSDVCSSDLRGQPEGVSPRRSRDEEGASTLVVDDRLGPRSEERRVGKECRARWSAYQENEKRQEDGASELERQESHEQGGGCGQHEEHQRES